MAAAQPEYFNGQDFSLSRAKRFVLPPQFRKALKFHNPTGQMAMLLGKDPQDDCLVGFSLARQAELHAEITAAQAGGDQAISLRRRKANAFSFELVPFDASGRFVLPDTLAVLADIKGEMFFEGGFDEFFVWSPAVIATKVGAEYDISRKTCQLLRDAALGSGAARADAP